MIPGFFINALATFLQTLVATLPPWTITLGNGTQPDNSTDHSLIATIFNTLGSFDRFFPIHDGLIPILGLLFLITTVFLAIKGVKFALSLIPTIGAGG